MLRLLLALGLPLFSNTSFHIYFRGKRGGSAIAPYTIVYLKLSAYFWNACIAIFLAS